MRLRKPTGPFVFIFFFIIFATLALAPEARAALASCATPWANFTGPNGFVRQYTYLGADIRDHEASGQGGDPSNGGTGVNPNSIDISSAAPASPPGPESSVAFGYYDGGTPWDTSDPATLEDDFIFFRMRIGANPRDNSTVAFDAYHWNILFDLNADGYKDYWIDVEGPYGTNGNPDRIQILYDAAHSQLIASADPARVEQFTARASTDAGSCGGAGTSHTRTYPVGDGSGDWLLEVQVPITAFNDHSGNQLLFPDSPVAFVYTTGASNQDPLQKDHMMDLDYVSSNDPITFGDVVTPSGLPSIEFTDAALRPAGYYMLGGDVFLSVIDRLADTDPTQPDCITATVTDPVSGDDEPVRLCETGPSTGLFTNRGGLGAITVPRDSASPPNTEGWLTGVQTTTTTLEARWELVYESASGGQWAVRYSLDGGASWTTLTTRAEAGTPYTAAVGGLTQVSFTVQENDPDPGDTISFRTTAGERLPTTAVAGSDDDGAMATDSGRTLYVSYTNAGHYTVTDAIPVLGPCGALVHFTRSTGLLTNDYDITSSPSTGDALYVTVTAPSADTSTTTAQTITVTLVSTRPGGDSQVLTLTETGVNTGVFRNSTGLATVVASASYPVASNNNRWEDIDGGAVTATFAFACGGSAQSVSTTATLFTAPGGGRVAFTNGAGTEDVALYTPGAPVFVQVTDPTVSSTCLATPYASGTVRVTVRSSIGDSETLVLYETAPGSGIFRNERYDLATTAGTAVVSSASVTFAAGQTLAIATGPDAGLYTILSATGGTATLDRALGATRTGIAFALNPLRTRTYDGAATADDGVLEGVHDGDLSVEYVDCNDGDSDASNNLKTDSATYNAPAMVVNRVLFAPDAPSPSDPAGADSGKCQQEMVEIYNQTADPVNATGYVLRDEDLQLDYTVPQLGGADIVLQPGGRIVLSIGGYYTDFQAGSTYYLFTGAGVNPDGTLPNWLGGAGDADPADQVVLLDGSGRVVDYVGWSGTASPSVDFLGDDASAVTAALWQDDSYRSTASLAVGQALARTSDGVDTNVPADWSVVADSTCDAMIAAFAATRATVRGLRVDRAGLVEFATGTQQGSRSFRVLAAADAQGRRLFPLHDRPVAAVVSDSITPILYRVETAPIGTPFVAIEETDVRGASRLMGPFAVESARLARQLERIETELDRADVRGGMGPRLARGTSGRRLMQGLTRSLAGHRRSPRGPRRRVPADPAGVKLRVREAGLVSVPAATLLAHGAPDDPRRFRVTAQGRPVPFQIGREGIRFQAEELSTDFSGTNVYVISWQGVPREAVPLSRSGDAPWPGYTRVEKSYAYVPALPREADPWQWDLLLTGVGSWPYDWWDPAVGEFDLPGYQQTRGSVRVALRLVGFTAHTHTVAARINGVAVGSVAFEGTSLALLEGAVPATALLQQGNRLELDYDANVQDPATEYGMVYFDHLDVGYRPEAAPRAPVSYEVLPWDPAAPIRGADYLIVTHGDFAAAASRIAAAKAAEGLRPAVLDVERAYDAYSAGIPEANAVAALVRDFAAHGGRYVLLVGDDTFDPRDYTGTGAVSFVPSAVRFDEIWGRVPSENGYADVDGDGRPELAIGRLPTQTPEEADLLADKIIHQRERLAVSAGRQLVAVDNRGPGDPAFRKDATAVPVAPGTSVAWADVGDGIGLARKALFEGMAAGAQVLHYFGHGGPELWADEHLLTVGDVPTLPAAAPAVLFTWACQSQWYLNLWGPSLNEALLLHPQGGALASFGPAGITTPREQQPLADGVYRRFLLGGRALGDAVREAKAEALAADPSIRPAVEGFNLLGDPALTLPPAP